MPIARTQVSGFPKGGNDREGNAFIEDQFIVPWNQVFNLMDEIFAFVAIPGTSIEMMLGEVLPFNNFFRAASASFKPGVGGGTPRDTSNTVIGPSGGTFPDYTQSTSGVSSGAVVTVTYRPHGFNDNDKGDDPIPFLLHDWRIGGQHYTIEKGNLEWTNSTEAVPDDLTVGYFENHITHQIQWPPIKKPPFKEIRDKANHVNSQNILFRTGTATPETMMFLGADIEEDQIFPGQTVFNMTYAFEEIVGKVAEDQADPAGWNHFWNDNEDPPGFFRLQKSYNGQPIFPITTFDALFGI